MNAIKKVLHVGLDSWIIQDGNYADFRVGESARFALEFHPSSIAATNAREPSSKHLRGCLYRICAQVIYASSRAWVIDFGLMAYQDRGHPSTVKEGDWFEAEIYLGIDPFFYFEELHSLKGMPALQYDWRITAISLKTTPWLSSKDESGRTILARDESRASSIAVAQTNAWHDDGGHGHYVLACEKT